MNRRIERASRFALTAALTLLAILAGDAALRIDREACAQVATGCAVGGEFNTPPGGFDPGAFDFNSASVDTNGYIQLDTGATALDPNNIVIPFEQDVYTTFLLEGAGYVSSIGWFVRGEAEAKLGYTLNAPLNFNSLTAAGVKINYLFRSVEDQIAGCCDGGDGILNKYYSATDAYLGAYPGANEGNLTTWGFTVDSSAVAGFVAANAVDPRDMKKYMAKFAANTEIIYFLHPNDNIASTWYSKTALNSDVWDPAAATKRNAKLIFNLAIASPEQGGPATVYNTTVVPNTATQGFIPIAARDRLGNPDSKAAYPANGYFDIQMSGTQSMQMTRYAHYSHFMLATPPDDPFKWILGVEDLAGGGDADFNDMMILIHRKTGGTAQLNAANTLSPADPNAYITSATVNVQDFMPCDGMTSIRYYLSVNNGVDWVEITDWTVIQSPAQGGATVTDWTFGTPATTYREATVNFMELGLVGRELTWKAELVSQLETCIPKIYSFNLAYAAAVNTEFSRSAPVALGNVLYNSSFETPAAGWIDKDLRGHLRSVEIYDPETARDAAVGLSNITNWDAGLVMSTRAPSSRIVKTPSVSITSVANELVGTGDGVTKTFTKTLASHPIVHSTVSVTDGTEIFWDKHTSDMEGSLTGTGTIDRYSGALTLTFNTAPSAGTQVRASYTAYSVAAALANFSAATNTQLALDSSQVTDSTGTHYTYDFNGDNTFTAADGTWLKNWVVGYRDGAGIARQWPMPAIDHSTPAYAGAPGIPSWYFGVDVTADQRTSWDLFRCEQRRRPTKVYVGSQMGMLHSFYAGEYRPYYVDPSVFSTAATCTSGNIATYKSAVNTKTMTDPISGATVPIYPGPSGGKQIVINKGYYAWESRAGASLATPNYGTGAEDWATIPTDQLPKLKNNYTGGEDHASVDASPTVAYVQFA
ncbi:MAG: hypothetical protein HQK87_02295, partial [Nitrospinae bacterium]|nr:hypothetical protein [Nitrospinota bacterium]